MAEQLDVTVENELAEVQADAGGRDAQLLQRVITGLTVNSPGIYYLLQAPDGEVIAGNMTAIDPKPGLRSLDWTHQARNDVRSAAFEAVALFCRMARICLLVSATTNSMRSGRSSCAPSARAGRDCRAGRRGRPRHELRRAAPGRSGQSGKLERSWRATWPNG